MIILTKLNGDRVYINPELIRLVESTPDTVLSFVDNSKFVVQESPEQIRAQVIRYRQEINGSALQQMKY